MSCVRWYAVSGAISIVSFSKRQGPSVSPYDFVTGIGSFGGRDPKEEIVGGFTSH